MQFLCYCRGFQEKLFQLCGKCSPSRAGEAHIPTPVWSWLQLARITNILWLKENKVSEQGRQALEQQHELHKAPCLVTAHLCGNSEIKRSAGEPEVNTGSADGTCPILNSVLQKIS